MKFNLDKHFSGGTGFVQQLAFFNLTDITIAQTKFLFHDLYGVSKFN